MTISLAFGVALGVNVNRYFAEQHERSTAVMVLLQTHLQSWEIETQAKHCEQATLELKSLHFLAHEIAVALPLADAQDQVFHQDIERLKQVLNLASDKQCSVSMSEIKNVRDACDECHREYR